MLGIISIVIWSAALREDRHGLLTVSFLDVGQGEAIFIDAPSGRQVLIDGGPDSSVLRELGKVMPWYDRSIDIIVATHPDDDDISGLIDVLQRYKVDAVVRSSVESSSPQWTALKQQMSDKAKGGMKVVTAQRGQMIELGKGVYIEMLSPDRPVPSTDPNTGCVVMRLVYGATSFMLPCDAPQDLEEYLAYLDGKNLHANALLAGKSGARTSSSRLFVGFVAPQYVVYSRGCNNKDGDPQPETLATMARFNIAAEDTCTSGTVTFVSDGNTVAVH